MSDIVSMVPVESTLVPTLTDPAVNAEQLTPIEVALALDKDGCTTAKKLYDWLELDETHYSRWVKVNILENPFAEEGVDFSPLRAKSRKGVMGRPSNDYRITATFAKKLAMTCPTEHGEQARIYFLMAEKIAAEKKHTEAVRLEGIIVRHTLTDALVKSGEMERMKGHAPSTYTDLIYKAVLGLSAKQLKQQRGITGNLRDFLTAEELAAIARMEQMVVNMLDSGCPYEKIKSIVMQVGADAHKQLCA